MPNVTTQTLTVRTPRRGLQDITDQVARIVAKGGVATGMCTLFIRHTSASLIIQENYDPSARVDLETFMDRLVPEGASWITHTLEGDDDMPSHIKSVLTQVSLSIPILDGKLALGTWQGIYLWEHRDHPTPREILVSLY
ncbi:MAG TPA: secondary thiamine-phosphate synthase enzyme YjbQ [Planctomycetota bacterium]|jgi:secondary thiamine-phosphate synthase enzyme|nr:secondary thiamine-phosphate synthase enzyme YjbQ [Planctomycetota bacterium]